MLNTYLFLILLLINSGNTFILNSITNKGVIYPSFRSENNIKINNLLKTESIKEIYYNYLVKYKYISEENDLNYNYNNNIDNVGQKGEIFLLGYNKNKYDYYAEKRKEQFKIFEKNYNLISSYNDQGINFKLDINQYTDQIDFSDDKNSYNNIKDINPNMLNKDNLHKITTKSILNNLFHPVRTINKYLNIPSNINWIKFLSPTKNQLNCGSCWAFSSTNCIESLMRINNYTVVRLSEQELVDFSKENYGCNGGLMHLAFKYIIDNGGLVSDKDYPYQGYQLNNDTKTDNNDNDNNDNDNNDSDNNDSDINENLLTKKNLTYNKVAFSNITKYNFVIPKSKSDLLASLKQGPVSIAIDASSFFFRFYKEGVIDLPYNYSKNINHAVLLTGYEKDGEEAYWIIQNSWGETWGDEGFAKIRVKEGEGVLKCQIYGVYPSYDD